MTREVRHPLVAYIGDTSPPGLDACPAMYEAKMLITEMTFVAPEHRKEKIHKFGHMHLDDFVGAPRPVQERADHRRPLQHALSPETSGIDCRPPDSRHARRPVTVVDLTYDGLLSPSNPSVRWAFSPSSCACR